MKVCLGNSIFINHVTKNNKEKGIVVHDGDYLSDGTEEYMSYYSVIGIYFDDNEEEMMVGIYEGFDDGFATTVNGNHTNKSHNIDGVTPTGVENGAKNLFHEINHEPPTFGFMTPY